MFTGIIEKSGRIERITPGAVNQIAVAITLDHSNFWQELREGASIAVNGCCLTIVQMERQERRGVILFDIGSESKRKTTLGRLRVGDVVNMERAMRMGARLDGHMVSGHVDAVGIVRQMVQQSDMIYLGIQVPAEYTPLMIYKGSITVDGVSLTINRIHDSLFEIALLPYTTAKTNLGLRKTGDLVNIEFDMFGKYVVRYLEATRGPIDPKVLKFGKIVDSWV